MTPDTNSLSSALPGPPNTVLRVCSVVPLAYILKGFVTGALSISFLCRHGNKKRLFVVRWLACLFPLWQGSRACTVGVQSSRCGQVPRFRCCCRHVEFARLLLRLSLDPAAVHGAEGPLSPPRAAQFVGELRQHPPLASVQVIRHPQILVEVCQAAVESSLVIGTVGRSSSTTWKQRKTI